MSDWQLRLARAEDAGAFHAIEIDAAGMLEAREELKGIPLPPPLSEPDYVRLIARGHCLSAVDDGTPVGFVACRPVGRSLHIGELSVATTHQQHGIGGALLRAIGVDARNSGFSALTLNTFRDVPFNAPFYARHGFVEVENFESWRHLQDSLDMEVALGLPAHSRIAMVRFLN